MRQRGIEKPKPTILPGYFAVQTCSEFFKNKIDLMQVFSLLAGKKVVCIGYNHRDGIGDFINLLDIQAVVHSSCPSVNIMAVIAIVGEEKFTKAKKITQERGAPENFHMFKLTSQETSEVNHVNSEFPYSAEARLYEAYKAEGLDEIIQNCDFVINVATRSVGCMETVQRFNLNVPILSIGELGFRQQFNPNVRTSGLGRFPSLKFTDRFSVAMGFSKQDVGVKVKMLPLLEGNGFSSFQSVDQKMSGHILMEQDVEIYFQKTRLTYGYLQENIWFFIGLIAMECREQQEIQCLDFFLPITLFATVFLKKRSGDVIEGILQELKGRHEQELIECGIKELQVFVLGEGSNPSLQIKKVHIENVVEGKILRIFDTHQFSEDERLTLRSLSKKMLGGSGDTSILDALLNSQLPFLEIRQWKRTFMKDLIEFVEEYGNEPLLTYYFKLLEGLFFKHGFFFDERSLGELINGMKRFLTEQILSILGTVLIEKGDALRIAWGRCVEFIKETRNIEQNMPYILLQTVVRSHPDVMVLEDLCYEVARGQEMDKIFFQDDVVERFLEIAFQIFEGKSQIVFKNFPEIFIEYDKGKMNLVNYVLKGEMVLLEIQKQFSYTLNPNVWFKPFYEKEYSVGETQTLQVGGFKIN